MPGPVQKVSSATPQSFWEIRSFSDAWNYAESKVSDGVQAIQDDVNAVSEGVYEMGSGISEAITTDKTLAQTLFWQGMDKVVRVGLDRGAPILTSPLATQAMQESWDTFIRADEGCGLQAVSDLWAECAEAAGNYVYDQGVALRDQAIEVVSQIAETTGVSSLIESASSLVFGTSELFSDEPIVFNQSRDGSSDQNFICEDPFVYGAYQTCCTDSDLDSQKSVLKNKELPTDVRDESQSSSGLLLPFLAPQVIVENDTVSWATPSFLSASNSLSFDGNVADSSFAQQTNFKPEDQAVSLFLFDGTDATQITRSLLGINGHEVFEEAESVVSESSLQMISAQALVPQDDLNPVVQVDQKKSPELSLVRTSALAIPLGAQILSADVAPQVSVKNWEGETQHLGPVRFRMSQASSANLQNAFDSSEVEVSKNRPVSTGGQPEKTGESFDGLSLLMNPFVGRTGSFDHSLDFTSPNFTQQVAMVTLLVQQSVEALRYRSLPSGFVYLPSGMAFRSVSQVGESSQREGRKLTAALESQLRTVSDRSSFGSGADSQSGQRQAYVVSSDEILDEDFEVILDQDFSEEESSFGNESFYRIPQDVVIV